MACAVPRNQDQGTIDFLIAVAVTLVPEASAAIVNGEESDQLQLLHDCIGADLDAVE